MVINKFDRSAAGVPGRQRLKGPNDTVKQTLVFVMPSSLLFLSMWITSALASPHWQGVLDVHRTQEGRVDYAAIKKTDAVAATIDWLATAEEPTDRFGQIAFWVNAYNALTVDMVADSFPVASIKTLDQGRVWKTRRFTVAGRQLSLDQIEHEILIPLGEPRIHFVLNCAALSCPPLGARTYIAKTLNADLNQASRGWMKGGGVHIDRESNKMILSRIFDWYAGDFVETSGGTIAGVDGRLQGVLHFISQHMGHVDAEWIKAGGYTIEFAPYDWALNVPVKN